MKELEPAVSSAKIVHKTCAKSTSISGMHRGSETVVELSFRCSWFEEVDGDISECRDKEIGAGAR